MRHFKWVFLLIILGFGCNTSDETIRSVHRLPEGIQPPSDAVIYALPRTTIRVTVHAEKVVERKGPFSQFGDQFLGLKGGIERDRIFWRLTAFDITSYEELDPDHFYVIEPADQAYSNYLQLTRSGLVLAMDPQMYRNIPHTMDLPGRDIRYSFFTDQSVKRNVEQYSDTTYRLVQTDTSFIRVPYVDLRERYKTDEEKAEEAANFIIKIRKRRFKLMAGQYEGRFPEGEALEYAVRELTRLENEYHALFLGKTLVEGYSRTLDWIPPAHSEDRDMVLFKFSEELGILPPDAVDGSPMVLKSESLGTLDGLKSAENINQGVPNPDLIYRVPNPCRVTLSDGEDILAEKRLLIYQAGRLVRLPGQASLPAEEK
mgnify:CR=1 FL=1